MKDLNKDLSRKLEAQTQILELLTAQSMANNGNPAKHPDPRSVLDNTAYADEGDEVRFMLHYYFVITMMLNLLVLCLMDM